MKKGDLFCPQNQLLPLFWFTLPCLAVQVKSFGWPVLVLKSKPDIIWRWRGTVLARDSSALHLTWRKASCMDVQLEGEKGWDSWFDTLNSVLQTSPWENIYRFDLKLSPWLVWEAHCPSSEVQADVVCFFEFRFDSSSNPDIKLSLLPEVIPSCIW